MMAIWSSSKSRSFKLRILTDCRRVYLQEYSNSTQNFSRLGVSSFCRSPLTLHHSVHELFDKSNVTCATENSVAFWKWRKNSQQESPHICWLTADRDDNGVLWHDWPSCKITVKRASMCSRYELCKFHRLLGEIYTKTPRLRSSSVQSLAQTLSEGWIVILEYKKLQAGAILECNTN